MSEISKLDLSSVEVRIAAATTHETHVDKYKMEASRMFRVPVDQVTPQQRNAAKQALYLCRYHAKGF